MYLLLRIVLTIVNGPTGPASIPGGSGMARTLNEIEDDIRQARAEQLDAGPRLWYRPADVTLLDYAVNNLLDEWAKEAAHASVDA